MHEAFPTQQTAHWLGLQLCHPQSDADLLRLHPATSVAVSHITAHKVIGIFLSSSLVCRVCDRGVDFASAAGCKSWSCVWPSELGAAALSVGESLYSIAVSICLLAPAGLPAFCT